MIRPAVFTVASFASITLFALLLQAADGAWLYLVYNSDALYLPDIVTDLINGRTIDNWQLTPAPYYFPDLIIYTLIALITDQLQIQVFSYALVQYGLLIAALGFLFRCLKLSPIWAPVSCAILLLITISGTDNSPLTINFLIPGTLLYTSAHHFSAFILALVFVALSLSSSHPRTRDIAQASLVLLMAASDLLFILITVGPYLMAQALSRLHQSAPLSKRTIALIRLDRTSILLITATLIGILLNKLVLPGNTPSVLSLNPAQFGTQISQLKIDLGHWFGHSPIVALSWLTGLAAMAILSKKSREVRQLTLYWVSANLITLLALVTVIEQPNFRYLPLLYMLPILVLPLFILQIKPSHQKVVLTAVSSSLALWAAMLYLKRPAEATITHYYPEYLDCIDSQAQKHELENGLSNYWMARHTTLLSRNELNVLPVTPDIYPFNWIVNRDNFNKTASLQFIVLNERFPIRIEMDELKKQAGQPDITVKCGPASLLIYQNQQLERAFGNRLQLTM